MAIMENNQTIQYQYAFDAQGRITDIKDADRNRSEYHCIACDAILTPVQGKKRQWHFRHSADLNCSPETLARGFDSLPLCFTFNELSSKVHLN